MKKFFAIFAIAVFAVACAGNQQPKATEEAAVAVDTVVAVVDTVAVVVDSTVVAQ